MKRVKLISCSVHVGWSSLSFIKMLLNILFEIIIWNELDSISINYNEKLKRNDLNFWFWVNNCSYDALKKSHGLWLKAWKKYEDVIELKDIESERRKKLINILIKEWWE